MALFGVLGGSLAANIKNRFLEACLQKKLPKAENSNATALLGRVERDVEVIKAGVGEKVGSALVIVFTSMFGLLFAPVDLVLSLGEAALSRKHEFEADRYAAATLPDPEPLVTALRKLCKENLANLTPHPFHTFLHASHPPVSERIRAIRAASAVRSA